LVEYIEQILHKEKEILLMENEKRPIGSFFVPYKIVSGKVFVFLQRRSDDAPRNAGMIGLFGGAPEDGENPEDNFIRETREELNYKPVSAFKLGVFYSGDIMHVFAEKVEGEFEQNVTVSEGVGGIFVDISKLDDYPIPPRHKRVLEDLRCFLELLSSK
jgi:8-oxo-dGTP pyrophosphatase MutT (NUDIX family)